MKKLISLSRFFFKELLPSYKQSFVLKCLFWLYCSVTGKVELENLPLKKDALRHLGLPVEVKAGFIGKVQLQVPVRQIRSAPWLIAIEKLYLVATPVNLDEVNNNNIILDKYTHYPQKMSKSNITSMMSTLSIYSRGLLKTP